MTDQQPTTMTDQEPATATLIVSECNRIRSMLLNKNKRYGDSAINPLRVFSTAPADEQIKVRIDDKLSRIVNQAKAAANTPSDNPSNDGDNPDDDGENPIDDLIGYLILLIIRQKKDALAAASASNQELTAMKAALAAASAATRDQLTKDRSIAYWPDALEAQEAPASSPAFPPPHPLEHEGETIFERAARLGRV